MPKGDPIVESISAGISHCKLAVVVVSKDFVKKKWPMLELQHLIMRLQDQAAPTLAIIPIFYELEPSDLTSDANLQVWGESWRLFTGHGAGEQQLPLNVDSWREALETLKSLSGIVFPPGTWDYSKFINEEVVPRILKNLRPPSAAVYYSEDNTEIKGRDRIAKQNIEAIDEEVVPGILKNLRPPTIYYSEDNTEIKGRVYIAEAIENMFSKIQSKSKSQDGEAHKSILGLHGIGGYGKTTTCKIMVDFHNQHRHLNFRPAWMQIPSNKEDKKEFVKQLKIATKKIAHIRDDLFSKINDVNEAINIFLGSIKGLVVFLAIDNMWEWSILHVKQILRGLTPGSKVMVTSRSKSLLEQVFKELKEGFEVLVEHIPTIDHEEALEALCCYSGIQSDAKVRYMVDKVVRRCTFYEGCHPLLLKAIASMLGRVGSDNIIEMQEIVDQVIIDNGIALEESVVLSLLSTFTQKFFLWEDDLWPIFLVVILHEVGYLPFHSFAFCNRDLANIPILEWITLTQRNKSNLHEEKFKVKQYIRKIESLGMWMVKDIDSCRVEVHDLYIELALKNAKELRRYFWQFVDISAEKNFRGGNLEVLEAVGRYTTHLDLSPWVGLKKDLDLSPWVGSQLRILILPILHGVTNIRGLGSAPNLQLLSLSHHDNDCNISLETIEGLDALMNLRILDLQYNDSHQPLLWSQLRPEQFKYLRKFYLKIIPCDSSEECSEVGTPEECSEVGTLEECSEVETQEECSEVGTPEERSEVGTLEECSEVGTPEECSEVGTPEECNEVGTPEECREPFQFRTLEECRELEELKLEYLDMEELILPKSSLEKLKTLNITYVYCLKMLRNLSGCRSLEILNLSGCTLLKTLSDLSSLESLKTLTLYQLDSLEELPSLGQLSKLETLKFGYLGKLKVFPYFTQDSNTPGLKSLRSIELFDCSLLKSFPNVTGLLSLKTLKLIRLPQLERLPDVSGLKSLEALNLSHLQKLERLSDVSGLKSLRTLYLEEIPLLKSLPGVSGLESLEALKLSHLQQLESLPDISGLKSLETLNLSHLQKLERLSDISGLKSLRTLYLEEIPLLKSLPGVSGLESLIYLKLKKLPLLKSLPALIGLKSLLILNLIGLQQLERLQNASGLESLENLELEDIPLLKSLPDLTGLKSLTTLRLIGLQQLESLAGVSGLESLIILKLEEIPLLKSLPDVSRLESLKTLRLIALQNLESLPDLTGLKSLETLDLKELPQLESLPDLTGLNNFASLSLRNCGSLKSLPPSIEHLPSLRRINIWQCGSLILEPTFNLEICSFRDFE